MQVARNAFFFLAFTSVNKAIPFALLPILTRVFTQKEFGEYALYQVLFSFSVPILGLALNFNISKKYYQFTRQSLAQIIGNVFFLISISCVVWALFLNATSSIWSRFVFFDSKFVYFLIISVFGFSLVQIVLLLFRFQNKPYHYGFFEVGVSILNALVLIICAIYYEMASYSIIFSLFISYLLFGLISVLYMYKNGNIVFRFNVKSMKESLLLSVPIVPHVLSAIIISLSDRIFVERMVGSAALAIYSAGCTFGMVILLFTDSFNKAWSPWLYKQFTNMTDIKKGKIVIFTYLYVIGMFLFAIVIYFSSSYLIPIVLPAGYGGSLRFVLWVALGFSVQALYFMVFPYIIHSGITKNLTFISCTAALLNMVGNFFLIKVNGPIGAAQSTLIAYSFQAIVLWWFSNRVYPMPWNLFLLFKLRCESIQKNI